MDVALGAKIVSRYACAIASSLLALALTWWLGPEIVGLTPLFFAAVMISAWYGGLGPGLVATVLAGLSSAIFFAEPPLSLSIGADDVIRELVFIFVAVLISYLNSLTRRSEANLRQARAEAESASRAKDHFLAVLSHELRNPLNPALAAASLHESDATLPEAVREDMAMIRRNIELEVRLIDDLLDLNRIGHGKLSMRFEPADVHELIDDVVRICREELSSKTMRLVVHRGAAAPLVSGDAARLRQVIWNLLKNAIKFTAPRGTITIETRDLPDAWMELGVRDSGVGIEPEALTRIFFAFDQGGGAVAGRFGGLGLGLSISRMLVEAHGGSIEAASEGKGKGASFIVRLPTIRRPVASGAAEPATEPAARPAPAADAVAARCSLRILLVEDDEDTRRLMSKLLRRRHAVCATGTVSGALEAAERERFDLVIADLGLPDGSGLQLMTWLRERYSLSGIALTGYGSHDDVVNTRRAGFVDHLTKPVDLKRLEAAIDRAAASAFTAGAMPLQG